MCSADSRLRHGSPLEPKLPHCRNGWAMPGLSVGASSSLIQTVRTSTICREYRSRLRKLSEVECGRNTLSKTPNVSTGADALFCLLESTQKAERKPRNHA